MHKPKHADDQNGCVERDLSVHRLKVCLRTSAMLRPFPISAVGEARRAGDAGPKSLRDVAGTNPKLTATPDALRSTFQEQPVSAEGEPPHDIWS